MSRASDKAGRAANVIGAVITVVELIRELPMFKRIRARRAARKRKREEKAEDG